MKNRKISALLLALVMSLSCLCVSALAADVNIKASYLNGRVRYSGSGFAPNESLITVEVYDTQEKNVVKSDSAEANASGEISGSMLITKKVGENLNRYEVFVRDYTNQLRAKGSIVQGDSESGSETDKPTGGAVGGAGGGAAAAATNVEVSKASNGSIKVSSTTAKAGDKVTVTMTPNSGYEADTLTVKDKSGAVVTATKNSDGTYSFTMPGTDKLPVSVSATFKAIEVKPITTTPLFTDVDAKAYYADAVQWAVEKGVTNGTSANTFSPDASCTRGQVVTFLWRAAGSPEPTSTNTTFADLGGASAYYYKAVLWAVENGITNGTSDTAFSPNAIVNRGQVVTFLYRYEKATSVAGDAFNDVAAAAYYAPAVNWAVANSITNGTGANTFSPDAACTRGQIVTFLYRDMVK